MPGWKQYVNLETLDVDEVQDLVNQGVLPYATVAARDSAITAPVAGMVSLITSLNRLDWHDGTDWQVGPTLAPTVAPPDRPTIWAQTFLLSSDANGVCNFALPSGLFSNPVVNVTAFAPGLLAGNPPWVVAEVSLLGNVVGVWMKLPSGSHASGVQFRLNVTATEAGTWDD